MKKPSHLPLDKLTQAQIFANHAQTNVARAQYLIKVGEGHQKEIEWVMKEEEALRAAKEVLENDTEK